MSAAKKIDPDEMQTLQKMVYDACGLVVPDHKKYLFDQRLQPLIEELGVADASTLIEQAANSSATRQAIVHRMTTHETSWFRDGHPFEMLEKSVLPEVLRNVANRKKAGSLCTYSVWSAACSTGQEPFTVAMLMAEILEKRVDLGLQSKDARILATDISGEVVRHARTGRFKNGPDTRGLSARWRDKYFEETPEGDLELERRLRDQITFRQLGLTSRFTVGPFDLVLCRNVLIYFDEETKRSVLKGIIRSLHPGGYLLLGTAETIRPELPGLEVEHIGRTLVYRRSQ